MADETKVELKEVPAPAKRDYPHIKIPPPGKKARAVVRRDEKHSSSSYIKVYPLVVAPGVVVWSDVLSDMGGMILPDWGQNAKGGHRGLGIGDGGNRELAIGNRDGERHAVAVGGAGRLTGPSRCRPRRSGILPDNHQCRWPFL